MIDPFVYTSFPSRVVFGAGTLASVAEEVRVLGASRVIVLATAGQKLAVETLVGKLGPLVVEVFDEAAMHTPVEVTRRALKQVKECDADILVALGGGSAIGLSKAIALHTDLPQLVVPTTYAGSEMTPILGQTEGGVKTTLRSAQVLPETVLYDVDLTLGLPVGISGASALNAIAHAAEALYAKETNPVCALLAEDGIRAIGAALPRLRLEPRSPALRREVLYGAWLCGICLATAGMALHHKLCHTLGGSFNLPHAETHAVILPHALAYNAEAAPVAMAALSRALNTANPPQRLFEIAGEIGVPRALKDLGMAREDIDSAVGLALANPYWNPRPLELNGLRQLLERAWAGDSPASG